MVVRFQLSALKRTEWYEVFLRILFGKVATVATDLIAKSFAPHRRGIVFGISCDLPGNCIAFRKARQREKAACWINGTVRARNAVALEARGAAMGSIGLAVFAIVVWKFLSGKPPWVVIAAAG